MTLKVLLAFIPISLALRWFEINPIFIFGASALAIIPLAVIMGAATEALAERLGPTYGGLLNATLGNAPELIISLFALAHGLINILKSSLCGAILGNLLFGMGLSMFAGGLKNGGQFFDTKMTRLNASLLLIVTFGLIIPSVFHFSAQADEEISLEIALVLFLLYFASIVYTLITHKPAVGLLASKPAPAPKGSKQTAVAAYRPRWSRNQALVILAVVAAVLAIMSELLSEAIQPAAEHLGLTPIFAGLFLLALVGNLAEYINATRFALANRMDLALIIVMGSSTQLALLVAPVLVIVGFFMGRNMNLLFSHFEIIAVILAVILNHFIIEDGNSNWLEGLMLLAVYAILGFAFFHVPAMTAP